MQLFALAVRNTNIFSSFQVPAFDRLLFDIFHALHILRTKYVYVHMWPVGFPNWGWPLSLLRSYCNSSPTYGYISRHIWWELSQLFAAGLTDFRFPGVYPKKTIL